MYDLISVLDAPTAPVSRIQIARLGEVKDPRYQDLSITPEMVQSWKTNLGALPGGRALIDFEHRSEKSPRDSKAAGWVSDVTLDGEKVMANVTWTPLGRQAVEDQTYSFVSPAFGDFTNDAGETFGDTLCSVALTNKPALTGLPVLQLASPERLAQLDAAQTLDAPDRDELVRLLDLPAGADERTILDAVRDLRAASGRQAFDHAFDDALRHLRVTPAEREPLERVYALDQGLALELLGSRPPIVATRPHGAPSIDLTHQAGDDPARLMEAGIHPEGHELDQQIKRELRERGLPPAEYVRLLDERMGGSR